VSFGAFSAKKDTHSNAKSRAIKARFRMRISSLISRRTSSPVVLLATTGRRRARVVVKSSKYEGKRRRKELGTRASTSLGKEENANKKSELKTIENAAVVTRLWSNVSEDADGGGYAHEPGSVLGNAALIAGTTVGAGVLALPEITGPTGFLASSEMLVAMWAYFVATGYCLAEVNLATLCALGGSGSENGVSLFSVTRSTLGEVGAAVFSMAYVFMHECLTIACCLKGAEILSSGKYIADIGFNEAIVLFGGFIGLFVALSSEKVLDFTNRLLVLFIVSALIGLVSLCIGDVDVANLQRSDFSVVGNTIPGIAVAFVYQSVLPSVVSSLEGDVPKIKKATVLGTAVPLGMFLLWNTVVLGALSGEDLMAPAVNPVDLLASKIENGYGTLLIDAFSFSAVATSFIGFTIGLKTFIADGLQSVNVKSEPISYALTLIPPLTFAITYPDVFISAIDNAGTFGVIVIFGLLPPMMVYNYRKSAREEFEETDALASTERMRQKALVDSIALPGGDATLFAIFAFSAYVILQETLERIVV
jgi:tyrosine-specific transport protein